LTRPGFIKRPLDQISGRAIIQLIRQRERVFEVLDDLTTLLLRVSIMVWTFRILLFHFAQLAPRPRSLGSKSSPPRTAPLRDYPGQHNRSMHAATIGIIRT
jgi:hypothetical protein